MCPTALMGTLGAQITNIMNYQELKEKQFSYAYGAALHDAVNQQAFQGKEIPLRKNKKAQIIVKEYIDDILMGNEPCLYEAAGNIEASFKQFIEVHCDEIISSKKDGSGKPITPKFRFGNAQKLINMTVKNMYLLAYTDENLRIKFRKCHCPMDNRIIGVMKNALKKLMDNGNPKAAGLLDQWKACGSTAWSRIESSDIRKYDKFQEIIRFLAEMDGISPIEYDYKMWE